MFNSGLLSIFSQSLNVRVKREIFVSYHHAADQSFYEEFSRAFHDQYEVVNDSSLDRDIDSDNPEYVMRRIRENYIKGTSCTIVLCGWQTPWRKYVDWEIKASLDMQHGLVGVLLPTNPILNNGGSHKPDRLQDNVDSGYAVWTNWTTLSGEALTTAINSAVAKSSALIINNRPLLQRNGEHP